LLDLEMREEFLKFMRYFREMCANGTFKISVNLSTFDLAVYYAVSKIGEKKGYPCYATTEEVLETIKLFAPEVME